MNEVFKKLLGNKWLLTLLAIGLLLLLFGATSGGNSSTPNGSGATPVITTTSAVTSQSTGNSDKDNALATTMAYEHYYNTTLTKMLNQIQGVSDVMVMVTVDSTPVMEYGQNTVVTKQNTVQTGTGNRSNTTSQSTQSTLVTVQNANGNQVPITVSEKMPKIRGVLVIAKAQDPIVMEAEITNALQDALGIPSYEITVLMRK